MNAFCEDWKNFEPVEISEASGIMFRNLKYWSLVGFLIFVIAVILTPFIPSEWVIAIGTAGGLIWVVFGSAYRRAKFINLK